MISDPMVRFGGAAFERIFDLFGECGELFVAGPSRAGARVAVAPA